MKYKDLATMKPAEMEKKEAEVRTELVKLQAQVATGTAPKNPSQIKQLKKIIARMETLRTAQSKQQKPTEEKQQDA